MNLLMTATPLAMDFCSLPYAQAAIVISWHVVGMYAPGFVTGSLIDRFGVLNVILAGVAVMAGGAVVALTGNDIRALPGRAGADRRGLELHVHRRHDAPDRELRARREGAHAGRQRLHHVLDDGHHVVLVRRLGHGGRLGDHELERRCRSCSSSPVSCCGTRACGQG